MIQSFSDRHIMALNYLLITVLAYFAALAANDILTAQSRDEHPVAQVVAKIVEQEPAHSRSDYQAIVDRDIFNLVVKVEAPPPPVVEDLHLLLIGISRMSKGKPFAIVQDQRGTQSVYRVGEMIPDSGKLVAVEKDRAIIERDGRKIALELPKDDVAGPSVLRRLGRYRPVEEADQPVNQPEPEAETEPGAEQEQAQ